MSKHILVFHGMYQDGDIMRYKCKKLRDILRSYGTLHFITATIPYQNEYSDDIDLYGWWNDDDEWSGSKESIQHVRDAYHKFGPFDGVIGFSQGATMISLLCALKRECPNDYEWFNPTYVICICGMFENSCYDDIFMSSDDDKIIVVPSLHVIGKDDDIKDLSMNLTSMYKNPVIKMYESSHEIPSQTSFYRDVVSFIQMHDDFVVPVEFNYDVYYNDDQLEDDYFFDN